MPPVRAGLRARQRRALGHRVGKIDTAVEQELAAAAGISSIPTLMPFHDGVLVFSQPGALPTAALAQVIDAVRDLDMDMDE